MASISADVLPHSNGTSGFTETVDSLRGFKETSWSWETRKKFIMYHMTHSQLPLDMINCYAWTLANSRTMGCRYDSEHIAALNLLAVEADIEQDLEMGGPTPVIMPSGGTIGARRGRGRGGGEFRGTNGSQRPPMIHSENGNRPKPDFLPRPIQIQTRVASVPITVRPPLAPVTQAPQPAVVPLIPFVMNAAPRIEPSQQTPRMIRPILTVAELEADILQKLNTISLSDSPGQKDVHFLEASTFKQDFSSLRLGGSFSAQIPSHPQAWPPESQLHPSTSADAELNISNSTRMLSQTFSSKLISLPKNDLVISGILGFLRQRPRQEIIVRLCGELVEKNASRILHETIEASKASRFIRLESLPTKAAIKRNHSQFGAAVWYSGNCLCRSSAGSEKDSKNRVAFQCLIAFVQHFDVVKISPSDGSFVQSLTRVDFLSGAVVDQIVAQVENPVSSKPSLDSSVGYRLMRAMGWTVGQGLGRHSTGMLYAISTSSTAVGYNSCGRPGLGFRDNTGDQLVIADRCEEVCQLFLANAVLLEDLVFSSDFSLEEREILHAVAEKYGLSHNSVGSGDRRHMVIRFKWALPKLVEELRRVGGKTGRYELIEHL